MADAGTVDFWFDPGCPFTWRTSRWLVDVAERRGAAITWHLMSLAILNEGKEIPEPYRTMTAQGRAATLVFQAVLQAHGPDALARLYTEYGLRRHQAGADLGPQLLRESLVAAGLPEDLATAGDDDAHLPALAADHEAGQARVGQESGSPIVAIGDGPGFFGPVVVPVPGGDEALDLFDAVSLLSRVPSFSELKRARASF
jgi:hypothetical protein